MQMTLTITAESPSELVTILAALQGAGVGTPVHLVAGGESSVLAALADKPVVEPPMVEPPQSGQFKSEPPKDAPRRGRPPKPVEEKTETTAKLKVVPKTESEPKAEPDPITILDIRRALTEFLQANSEVDAAALLAKHGKTDRLSKLEPQYFTAVYRAAVTPAKVVDPFDDDISDIGAKR
jgi:hypothetical protein